MSYEVTWYVNPGGTNIRDIHPYSAYNLSTDEWDVEPDPNPQHPSSTEWEEQFSQDRARALSITSRYNQALEEMHGVHNPGLRLNSEITLRAAAEEGISLFDEIHSGRHAAFGPEGHGYADYANHRWQQGKASGAIPALKAIKDAVSDARGEEQVTLYGSKLPDARESLVAAAVARRHRG